MFWRTSLLKKVFFLNYWPSVRWWNTSLDLKANSNKKFYVFFVYCMKSIQIYPFLNINCILLFMEVSITEKNILFLFLCLNFNPFFSKLRFLAPYELVLNLLLIPFLYLIFLDYIHTRIIHPKFLFCSHQQLFKFASLASLFFRNSEFILDIPKEEFLR